METTEQWLTRMHAERERVKFGVAAIGCALVLSACGGGDDSEDEKSDPPKRRPVCGEMRAGCL